MANLSQLSVHGYINVILALNSTTKYSSEPYEDITVQFAKDEGIGQVDVAIVCDTTSSMGDLFII